MSKQVVIGRIGAPFGVKGWLKVNSFTDFAEGILDYSPWQLNLKGQWQTFEVEQGKLQGKTLVVKLRDINDRTAAEAYTNADIAIDEALLPQLPDDEFYWRDLIGLKVVTVNGYDLGQVSNLMETGSNDVLVVKANAKDAFGKRERLIPFLMEQVVQQIDTANGQLVVDWDPGF